MTEGLELVHVYIGLRIETFCSSYTVVIDMTLNICFVKQNESKSLISICKSINAFTCVPQWRRAIGDDCFIGKIGNYV